MKRLVIGILAHVDSGKTTLSEAMLFRSGEIRRLGRVDHGDAFLDTNEIEREKGITIFSKQAELNSGEAEITLLDTPGHVDFSTEAERTLQVLDYAVLVISGTDGVQNHTETLWDLLIRYNVPTFIFVNKMDISSYDRDALMSELKERLNGGCVDFSDRHGRDFAEECAMCSERLMEEALESESVSNEAIADAVLERTLFPCFFGSALKLDGVDRFLEALDLYTKEKRYPDVFGAKVFKISEDAQGKRLTHMKITGGSLKVKERIAGNERDGGEWEEKADRICIFSGERARPVDEAVSGEICTVYGLTKTYPGEGLGCEEDSEIPVLEPVLTYRVEPESGVDIHTALADLRRLEEEEPQLHVIWNEQLQEIHIQLMGEVQIEVLSRIIFERFGMRVSFGRGSISYRETIAAPVLGIGHFEPLRHYSEVHLLMEPLERGAGLIFETACPEDMLDRNWQRLILTHLKEKTHIGVLTGSPVTDMKITLVAGRAHKKHTEGGDFRQATYRAVRQGLKSAENILLEPWYSFRLEVPQENIGRVMTDIQNMGGEFSAPHIKGDISVITGTVPVSEMRDYHTELTNYTRGRGRLFTVLSGYRECHNTQEVIDRIAYDSDADIENPADSVFCSHGAGFLVKWDEVPNYAHVDSGVLTGGSEDEPEARAADYVRRAADDDELMRIFEKTYGPVKHRSSSEMRVRRAAPKPRYKSRPMPQGPLYLLVDGYNIIFAWETLKKAAEESLDLAREMLINRLANYRGFTHCELILVFDAYKVKGNPGEVENIHGISVVYTKEAETADMYIEKVTHELGKKHRVRVATSDNLEQLIILGAGAVRVSAAEFEKEVCDTEEEIRRYLNEMQR